MPVKGLPWNNYGHIERRDPIQRVSRSRKGAWLVWQHHPEPVFPQGVTRYQQLLCLAIEH
jgi:hypothetical protein